LGAGYIRRPGFTRVDIDKNCEPDIEADITDLSKIPSNYANEIWTSHTLEHTQLRQLFHTIRGMGRILKPGGKITVTVPDVRKVAEDWVAGKIPGHFFEKIVCGVTPDATQFMAHVQLFWKEKLIRFLSINGFVNIKIKHNTKTYELFATAKKPKEKKNAQL
jgi:predicted SAM-dependent methyltransferase